MWGTWVNVLAILAGTAFGIIIGKYLPQRLQATVTQATGLGILLVGLSMAIQSRNIVLVIVSLAAGGITGEALDIEDHLTGLGRRLERLFTRGSSGQLTRAFVSASLLYCVGAMAVMGSLEAGLRGNYNILYAKALLDGILAVTMSTTQGWGVALAALPVLIYQGSLTLMAAWLQNYLTPAAVTEITATGGLLIIAISLGVLKIKELHIGNLLPSLFFAALLALWWH
ncbi:putative membrane protein YdfK [Moorella thermoacetica]|uniref:Membrane protein YdfK n=1 Tax=Neomoorella thermoacetica TaxID=1525 RepID=A0A1D7XF23_NEOTH|nr:DUF554 domain-containing protein [Moorella thermoacetica]AOQ25486.1 putative membrane protein YdfK [Moorella thermoacetica]OIQ10177.1 putative membrane protein YdfK [Moorella thermoacetica]TYL13263.1 putative membrane protein YdfK [Moorella thermoacetica]